MPLRLVHVSDIHFHRDTWDEDADQRRELVDDLRELVLADGPVDAVLVGGDIAFSGQPHEYETARKWLDDLIAVCGGIDASRVYTVPGNHDVDVSLVRDSVAAQELRTTLRTCDPAAIDHELHRRVAQDPAGDGLFLPLAAYNEFATRYLCTTSREHPHWQDPATFDVDGWPVCLTGQNSVLVSDLLDRTYEDDDGHHRLVLGSHQCRLTREDQPIHVVMAHHPPEWIRDWAIVRHHMCRAHLWLYGHEHAYHSEQTTPLGPVQLSAGAVGPERDETGQREPWIPAYSLITLLRTEQETLKIHAQPRYWSVELTRFIEHPRGPEEFEVARLPAVEAAATTTANAPVAASQPVTAPSQGGNHEVLASAQDQEQVPDEHGSTPTAGEASPLASGAPETPAGAVSGHPHAASRPDLRRYATQFMSLPLSERIAIGQRLGVLHEVDLAAGNAPDVYRVILRRINEMGLVSNLIEELENPS